METTDDAVLGNDEAGRVAICNRSAERIFGRPADDVVGTPFADLFPPGQQAQLETVLATVSAGERVRRFETEILRRDGLPVPLSMSLCPVVQQRHEPALSAVVVARDITEQRLTQARLAEIAVQMRDSEAMAHVGSWLWDLRTDAVQWSDEFHRIHDLDPLDFEGTLEAHLRPVHPDDRDRVRSAMDDAARSDRPMEEKYRVRRPDGEERELYVRAHPTLDSNGVVVGLRGIGQDLTGG